MKSWWKDYSLWWASRGRFLIGREEINQIWNDPAGFLVFMKWKVYFHFEKHQRKNDIYSCLTLTKKWMLSLFLHNSGNKCYNHASWQQEAVSVDIILHYKKADFKSCLKECKTNFYLRYGEKVIGEIPKIILDDWESLW